MTLTLNQASPALVATSVTGQRIDLSAYRGQKVLLKFHRFSGCPVAQRQIGEVVERHAELRAAGLETIVLLHNHAPKVGPRFPEVPGVHVIADASKEHYRRFGSRFQWSKLLSFASWLATFAAFLHGYFPHFHRFEGGVVGLPSDFLIDERGVIVDLHYGEHFGDSWSVSDVLAKLAHAAALPTRQPLNTEAA